MLSSKPHTQFTLDRDLMAEKLKDEGYQVIQSSIDKEKTEGHSHGLVNKELIEVKNGRYSLEDGIESDNSHIHTNDSESELLDDESLNNDVIKYPDGGLKAYSVMFGSFIGMVALFGVMNSSGAFESWIKTHQLKDAPSTQVSWIFAIYSFLSFGGCVYSGPIFDTFGAKVCGIPGAIMVIAGLLGMGNSTKAYQFILSFGVCAGIGTALMVSPIVSCTSHWFYKRRGFAVGLSMVGASLGGVIVPLMCNGLYPKVGFTWTMRIFALFDVVLLGTSLFFLEDRVKEFNEADNDTRSIMQKIRDSLDFTALKDTRYSVLVMALFLNEFSTIIGFTYLSSYALSRGYSTSTSLIILTVVNASGMVGRYIPSHLSDHYGKFNMITFCSLLMSFSILVIWLPFGGKLPVFYFFGAVYGFAGAGTLSLSPSCTGQISKTRDFGKRYGTAYFFVSFGNLIALPSGMGIAGAGTKVAFDHMVLFGGITCLMGSFSFLLCRYLVGGFKAIV